MKALGQRKKMVSIADVFIMFAMANVNPIKVGYFGISKMVRLRMLHDNQKS